MMTALARMTVLEQRPLVNYFSRDLLRAPGKAVRVAWTPLKLLGSSSGCERRAVGCGTEALRGSGWRVTAVKPRALATVS
jgi:hypothetical protein